MDLKLKKRWIYVVFMLVLFPITTAAQTSLYGLPSGKFGTGFEIWDPHQTEEPRLLIGNLGLGFRDGNAKISLLAGRFLDASPTIYTVGIEGAHRYPIGLTGFEFFTVVEFLPFFVQDAIDIPVLSTLSGGLSKHIETGSGGLKPFAGLLYRNLILISGSETEDIGAGFGGVIGLEYKISWLSIIGTAMFPLPYEEDAATFQVGVNILHSTKERSKSVSAPIPQDETPPPVTVNFVSADPSSGSTIKPNATITVTFDDSPGPVAVTQGTATTAGRIVSISGPFSAGSLSLNISWADGVQRLTYTVDDPTPKGMVLVPAGEFQMGSNDPEAADDENPVHTVLIDAFYIDRYEVTNAQYQQFVLANPRWGKDRVDARFHDGNYLKDWTGNDYPSGKANHPVVSVSWYAAMAYAQWAGKRLPTEAEWEKAARSGWEGQKYLWYDGIDSSKANYNKNVGDTTAVGKYPPNSYGLYDMTGNVWEWCLDEYNADFYSISPRENPLSGPNWIISDFMSVQTDRVLRGGSWGVDSEFLRIAYRSSLNPASTYFDCGFRCVMSQ